MAAIVQGNLDRRCRNVDLAKVAGEIVSWEKYAPFFGLSPPEEEEIKRDSRQYVVQKRRMLERWKEKSGDNATYRNLIGIFERVEDQSLANYVYELVQHHKAQPHNRRQKPIFFALTILIILIALTVFVSIYLHQPANYPVKNYKHYVDNVKYRYKKHLPGVA